MCNEIEIIWDDQDNKAVFEKAGFTSFEDFWNIEKGGKIDLQVRRQHITEDGEIERQTVRVPFDGEVYYLKRTSASAYKCIKDEFYALDYTPEFGLVPPKTAAHCFDDQSQRGFILFKDMTGFYCLGDIYDKNIPQDIIEKIGDVTKYFPAIISIFKKFQKSDYFYRDWMNKHIFINPDTDEIGLIDLERFLPKSEVPFHWRLPFIYGYKRKKETKKLLKALRISSL